MIRVLGESAVLAYKLRLAFSVCLLAVTAYGTSATAVAWIDEHDWNASQPSLVCHELPELQEPPVSKPTTKALVVNCFLNTGSDAIQVFHRDPGVECLSSFDDLLCNAVVGVTLKSRLPTTHSLQFSLGSLGPLPLVLFACGLSAPSCSVDRCTAERIAFAGGCDLDYPKVDTEELVNLDGWLFGKLDRRHQVELAVSSDKVALSFDAIKSFRLIFSVDEPDNRSPFQSRKADFVEPLEAEIPLVIGDCPIRSKCRAYGLVSSECFHGFADGPHGELGRQPESVANLAIRKTVDAWLAEYASIESAACGERSRLVDASHRVDQQGGLRGSRQQLQLNG